MPVAAKRKGALLRPEKVQGAGMHWFGIVRWVVALSFLGTWWTLIGMPAAGMVLAIHAPPLIDLPAESEQVAAALAAGDDQRVNLGRCYRERVGSITHVHLAGSPVEVGYYQGVLIGSSIARIEQEMMGVFTERVPSFWARHLLLGLVNWNNRTLASHFTAIELAEIAAITEGHRRYHDPFTAVSPSFSRGLQYHALHDISQYLIDNPLVHPPQVGCTAVAVEGPRTTDGHLLVGRLFDFEGGSCFDRDKIVYTERIDGGIPFVSVAWGGMAGAVTGFNDAGLWVSINAAATDGQAFVGRPIVMTVRQILEHCRTIEAAIEVVRTSSVFVSNGVLIASGPERRVVVCEKGPRGFGVREMEDHHLVLTNHFLAPEWKDDKANAGRIANGTTTKRAARAEALIEATRHHDPASVLAVLRDRRGRDGADVGFGNRGTINAWIGAHLVVADITAKVIWVCEPWHGLGKATAFGIDGPLDLPSLSASEDLAIHDRDAVEYRRLEPQVKALIKAGKRQEAAPLAERLIALNPHFFDAYVLASQCGDAGSDGHSVELLKRALDLHPAYPADERAIRTLLEPGTTK